ncbi:solute carrier family 23 protein [Melaminivora sp.]|uniref:solute carrier family 23 protein n=1 Tax=Melaminivora sp. TaxID=1933032 RepID=UPI0028AD267C|nr:solute carrier family 23 protein [Melaminivora sp.]
MRRPDNIAFGVHDWLPPRLALGLALQQLAFLGGLMVIPGIYARTLGLVGHEVFLNLVSTTLLVSALVIWLQVRTLGQVGTGYYYPLQATGAVLPAMYLVGNLPGAGPEAVFGMVWVVGLSQIGFSFLIMRLRNVFTAEVSGVAVMLIGLGLGALGLQQMFGLRSQGEPLTAPALAAGGLALATMVGCNVWARGLLKLMAPLAGLLVGLGLGLALGLVPERVQAWQALGWLRLPQLPVFGWRFEAGAIVPYMITGFALALTSLGTQTIVQRSIDADWVRPHLRALARGVRAEGIAHLFASLINALPLAASGGAVSLAAASGSASRYLGYWTAALLLLAALVPRLIGVWLLLPAPVMGALLLYLGAFTTLSGLQLIASRMLDNRRVLAVGLGLVAGTGAAFIQPAIHALWPALEYVALSGLAIGVCVTVLLASLFRIGLRQGTRRRFALAQATLDDITKFLEGQGRLWGSRPEPVRRAELVGWQVVEALTAHHLVAPESGEIEIETGFDEYIFTLIVRYRGRPLPLAKEPPSAEALMASTEAELQMSGYLVGRSAHSARASSGADGLCVLRLTFEN